MIIKYNTKERDLLARLMRAEAVGEGDLGMLMVGNVVVNRALADCLTFKMLLQLLMFCTKLTNLVVLIVLYFSVVQQLLKKV